MVAASTKIWFLKVDKWLLNHLIKCLINVPSKAENINIIDKLEPNILNNSEQIIIQASI